VVLPCPKRLFCTIAVLNCQALAARERAAGPTLIHRSRLFHWKVVADWVCSACLVEALHTIHGLLFVSREKILAICTCIWVAAYMGAGSIWWWLNDASIDCS
jgi:hypothetical protein